MEFFFHSVSSIFLKTNKTVNLFRFPGKTEWQVLQVPCAALSCHPLIAIIYFVVHKSLSFLYSGSRSAAHGPRVHRLVLYSPRTQDGVYLFTQYRRKPEEECFVLHENDTKLTWQCLYIKFCLYLALCTCLCVVCDQLLDCYVAVSTETVMASCTKSIYTLALYRKCLLVQFKD